MPAPLHIIADHRERASGVPARLACDPGVTLTVGSLEVGDYLVADAAVFERKTVEDFARSIVDGRLFRQAIRMTSHPLPSVMIIEGAWPVDREVEGVDRRAYLGAVVCLAAVFRIPLLYSAHAGETADLIRYAAGQLSRWADDAVPRPGYRPKGRRKRQLYILQGLPGVGPGRAARLLDRFGSVERVMTAPEPDLAEIPGIGKGTARAIREAVQ